MSKYCTQLKATSFDHEIEAFSQIHNSTFYISDNDDIEIMEKKTIDCFGEGYLIRRKDSNGQPIFVRKENVMWFCGGCCEWYDHDPATDECDDCCELNFDGSIKEDQNV